jgi:hypothetical protein
MHSPVRLIHSLDEATRLREVLDTEVPALQGDYDALSVKVYLARASQKPWQSGPLHGLVAQSRESYRALYGPQVALFDEYDAKAWVYVAIASYTSQGSAFDEALTLRFVPAEGLPAYNDDINFYCHKGPPERPLLALLGHGMSSLNTGHTLRGCYSQSRMGALRPCARRGGTLAGNRHVGLSWSLMLECFLRDSQNAQRRCRLLTSQTTENLRILGAKIPTQPCDERLGLDAGSIALYRQSPHVRATCYGVPTYFLNLKDVSALLARLLSEGWLSEATAQAATTEGVSLERALRHPQPHTLKRLNLLFEARGKLPGSRLTGEDLRRLADDEVRDGPVLRLTQLAGLAEELEAQRRQAGARRPSSIRRRASHGAA